MQQNYHNIHHLYPMIPWYRYRRVWKHHARELQALGTPVANWLGPLRVMEKEA
jgi:fatty acid desaturase